MATTREWSDAYLAQAQEDLKAAKVLARKSIPSVFCMLLQMVFEKLAKAALLRGCYIEIERANSTHRAAGNFVASVIRTRRWVNVLGEGSRHRWKKEVALVRELERAHPALAAPGTPQLEYPWEHSSDGPVLWPAEHLPIVNRMKSPLDRSGPMLLHFADLLMAGFTRMFPA